MSKGSVDPRLRERQKKNKQREREKREIRGVERDDRKSLSRTSSDKAMLRRRGSRTETIATQRKKRKKQQKKKGKINKLTL